MQTTSNRIRYAIAGFAVISCTMISRAPAQQAPKAPAANSPTQAAPAQTAPAQASPTQTAPRVSDNDAAVTTSGKQIVVRREALTLIDPRTYRIGFQLEPKLTLEIIAPQDGTIVAAHVKIGDKVEPQFEVMRFDSNEKKLLLDRAKAAQKISLARLKIAEAQNDANAIELAQAEVEFANVEHEIAKQQYEQGIIRAPFAGEILDLNVVPGQFVRAGDRLLTLADTSQLKVEVPWERTAQTAQGGTIELKVEEQMVTGTIESIKPLPERFQKLRDLANSVASIIVVVNNPARGQSTKHFVGQGVYPPLIPRHSVTEIPTSSIKNEKESGLRRVQVLRDFAVRDITVDVLGSIGPDMVFISGPFREKDELILESSVELTDGTLLRPHVALSGGETPGVGDASTVTPQAPVSRSPGF